MKNYKKIIYPFLLIVLLIGCEEQLNVSPESSITSNSFWQTENDARGALYGMYSQFRSTFDFKLTFWAEFRSGYFQDGTSGGASDWDKWWFNELDANTSNTNWSELYRLINDANLILKYVPEIEFTNETEKNEILGQAYFTRSFAYFKLAQIWGDAPITTEGFESTDQEFEVARSPVGEVFDLVKSDIDQALNLLSSPTSGSEPSFINQATVNMLKTEVYLWTAKREGGGSTDLNTASQAIDAVLNAGYMLEENYETVFRDENSSEIILSIFYSEQEPSNNNHFATNTLNREVFVPQELLDRVPIDNQPQWLHLTDEFVSSTLNDPEIDSRTNVIWMEVENPGSEPVVWVNKYLGEVISGTREMTTDFIIYRYAEAILFKAEIENALGNTGSALTHLNIIAQRAYGIENYYSGLSQAEVDDAILDERIIEFVGEAKSFLDIRRFGKAFEKIPALIGREGEKSGNILLTPVAQDVLSRNTAIMQTEGY